MGFKDVLSNFKKEIANCYQSQKNIVDVSQRYIGLLEEAYQEGGSGGSGDIYSTEEREVGTWTDGSKIYEKTFTGLSVATNGTSWVNLVEISGIAQVIDVEMFRTASGNKITKMPIAESQVSSGTVVVSVVNATFNGTVNIARIRYIKS